MILPRSKLGRVYLSGGGVELAVDGREGDVSQGQQDLEVLHVVSEKYNSYLSFRMELISSFTLLLRRQSSVDLWE